jgi:hypothetical protein
LSWKDSEKLQLIAALDKSGTIREMLEREKRKPEKQPKRITDLDLFNVTSIIIPKMKKQS